MDRHDRYPGSPPGDFQFTALFLFLFLLFSLLPSLAIVWSLIEGRASPHDLRMLPACVLTGLLLLRAIRDLTDLPLVGRFRKHRRRFRAEMARLEETAGRERARTGVERNLFRFSQRSSARLECHLFSIRLDGIHRGRRIAVESNFHGPSAFLLHYSMEVSQRWTLKIVRAGLLDRVRRSAHRSSLRAIRHLAPPGLILSGDAEPLRAWLARDPERFEEQLTFLFDVCHVETIEMRRQRLQMTITPVNPVAETEPEAISRLLDLMFDLSRGFGSVAIVGIPESESRCPFCHDPLSAEEEHLVDCLSCNTPYHAECWQLSGRCAVFGCVGREAEHC